MMHNLRSYICIYVNCIWTNKNACQNISIMFYFESEISKLIKLIKNIDLFIRY